MARVLDIEALEAPEDLDIAEIDEIDGPGTPTPKATRFESLPAPATIEELEISPTNVQTVSQITPTNHEDSETNTPTGVAIVSGIESPREGVEELVEIKPRARRPRSNTSSNNASAFAGVPDVERYDPNLTSNQLRVEGGQLRDRRDGNRARTLLLPSVFKPKYSGAADIDTADTDDNDNDSDGNNGDGNEGRFLSREQRLALSGVHVDASGKLRRRSAGSMGSGGHVIECAVLDTTEALIKLTRLLKREFGGVNNQNNASELRMKIPIDGPQRQIVVAAAGKWNGGCTLTFRKSLTDRSKLSPDKFLQWVERVRARMRDIEELQEDGS